MQENLFANFTKNFRMDLQGARAYILQRLHDELKPNLFYHSYAHTLDVCRSVQYLGQATGIGSEDLAELEIAALFHDSGMLFSYRQHEHYSASFARETLPGFSFPGRSIDRICRLIMITENPSGATTISEQILCDADLDYLGRNDYFILSFKLKLEWEVNGIKAYELEEWLKYQLEFLMNHKYFTFAAGSIRDQTKQHHIQSIRNLLTK
jgi:predicted metal-dependent HD superfamily phosphohydrolase